MKRVVNALCSFFKYILLIAAFGLTLYIILKLNARLEKNITDSTFIFIPYGILILLFILNIALNRKAVTKNIFFNITAVVIFATNIMVCLRTMYDEGMLFNLIQGRHANFVYFNDNLPFTRIMLFGLIIADIVFMFVPNSYLEEDPHSLASMSKRRKEKLKALYKNDDKKDKAKKDKYKKEEVKKPHYLENDNDEDVYKEIEERINKEVENKKREKDVEVDSEII